VNLRIQLELIYWATTPPVIIMLLILLYLYTQPNNRTHRSLSYKVPLHIYYLGYGIGINLNNMLLRAAPVIMALIGATTLGPGDTSMDNRDS